MDTVNELTSLVQLQLPSMLDQIYAIIIMKCDIWASTH